MRTTAFKFKGLYMNVKFDFYNDNKDAWLSCFCEYFNLEKIKTEEYFQSINPDTLTPNVLVNYLGLNLSLYDSSTMEIVVRHMTTTSADATNSFKDNGLLDLKKMLQLDTPLSTFLAEYGIKVNVDKKVIHIEDNKYPILAYDEPCKACYFDRDVTRCSEFSKCDLRKALEILALKLYKYGATIEFFIHATLDEMKRYSSICRCPEILQTLDKIRAKAANMHSEPLNMCYDWIKTHRKCYILEFTSKLSEMETYAPMDYIAGFREYGSCIIHSGYDFNDYLEKRVPQRVLDNLMFLRWFISIYFYDSEILGSLLPDKTVAGSKLKVIPVTV